MVDAALARSTARKADSTRPSGRPVAIARPWSWSDDGDHALVETADSGCLYTRPASSVHYQFEASSVNASSGAIRRSMTTGAPRIWRIIGGDSCRAKDNVARWRRRGTFWTGGGTTCASWVKKGASLVDQPR